MGVVAGVAKNRGGQGERQTIGMRGRGTVLEGQVVQSARGCEHPSEKRSSQGSRWEGG